jgi:hypothetical protein
MKEQEIDKASERVLTRLRYGMGSRLSKELISNIKCNTIIDRLTDNLIITMERSVWAENIDGTDKSVSYPSTWVDALKLGLFRGPLKFAGKLFPIKYSTITLAVRAEYPNFRPMETPCVYRVFNKEIT